MRVAELASRRETSFRSQRDSSSGRGFESKLLSPMCLSESDSDNLTLCFSPCQGLPDNQTDSEFEDAEHLKSRDEF
jgi:hypothetical protein